MQSVCFLLFNLMGQFTRSEVHTLNGRSDCEVETPSSVYIFELKITDEKNRDISADDALAQIEDKGYACPKMSSGKKICKVGIVFDSKKRKFSDWKVV